MFRQPKVSKKSDKNPSHSHIQAITKSLNNTFDAQKSSSCLLNKNELSCKAMTKQSPIGPTLCVTTQYANSLLSSFIDWYRLRLDLVAGLKNWIWAVCFNFCNLSRAPPIDCCLILLAFVQFLDIVWSAFLWFFCSSSLSNCSTDCVTDFHPEHFLLSLPFNTTYLWLKIGSNLMFD